MTIRELEVRMRAWLAAEYKAVIFKNKTGILAYALYRYDLDQIYLRQFFVARNRRRQGIGSQAVKILFTEVWPKNKKLLVDVLWQNKTAIAFWKAVGFKEYSLALEMLPGE
ncbi:MAG: GNAT family N-acetyltransferase [Deltaproteobacteria bacterium]|nr:GNAT family N-acetyltransferase [Deltaproteobacteria bacterium]